MPPRIRVLQLVASLAVGGAEQIVLSLAERLDPGRFETHIGNLSRGGAVSLRPEFERLPVPLLHLTAPRFYDPGKVLGVGQYARRQRIDVIHTHLTEADIIGRLVGRQLNLPVVSTLHNTPDNYRRQRRDHYWLERLTARHLATHLVAVSATMRRLFMAHWGIPPGRISVISNAVQLEPFLAVPEGVAPPRAYAGPVITNVARFSPQKAQHTLLQAAHLIQPHIPQARFLLVGAGSLEPALRQQAQALGITENVIFTGLRRDIPAILAQTDVFVLTSQWEGLPLAALEAMAAARPVVLTAVGGNPDLVQSGHSGVLIPPADAGVLAEILLALLRDEPRRWAIGRAARQRVQQHFSFDQFIHQHETLYVQLARTPVQPGAVMP